MGVSWWLAIMLPALTGLELVVNIIFFCSFSLPFIGQNKGQSKDTYSRGSAWGSGGGGCRAEKWEGVLRGTFRV